jgi:hypothetical protein
VNVSGNSVGTKAQFALRRAAAPAERLQGPRGSQHEANSGGADRPSVFFFSRRIRTSWKQAGAWVQIAYANAAE